MQIVVVLEMAKLVVMAEAEIQELMVLQIQAVVAVVAVTGGTGVRVGRVLSLSGI